MRSSDTFLDVSVDGFAETGQLVALPLRASRVLEGLSHGQRPRHTQVLVAPLVNVGIRHVRHALKHHLTRVTGL